MDIPLWAWFPMLIFFGGVVAVVIILRPENADPGTMREAWSDQCLPPALNVPTELESEAEDFAARQYRNSERRKTLANELLAMYAAVKDFDAAIVFNSGGFGWSALERSPGYPSIVKAIESQFKKRGNRVISLNFIRTRPGLKGLLSEVFNNRGH